jgi:hypothetical protein
MKISLDKVASSLANNTSVTVFNLAGSMLRGRGEGEGEREGEGGRGEGRRKGRGEREGRGRRGEEGRRRSLTQTPQQISATAIFCNFLNYST